MSAGDTIELENSRGEANFVVKFPDSKKQASVIDDERLKAFRDPLIHGPFSQNAYNNVQIAETFQMFIQRRLHVVVG